MYERLLGLYLDGRLTVAGLENAVVKGWITEAEKKKIVAAKESQTPVSQG